MNSAQLRQHMVQKQIVGRGIRARHLLDAMSAVPREAFVPHDLYELAYRDMTLPLQGGQTMSQPYTVAFMIETADVHAGERVLEIGSGTGYGAAVLARMGALVYTIERNAYLAAVAEQNLVRQGYENVIVGHGDGSLGWPEVAPFDAIIVTAGSPRIPATLCRQLRVGGRMIIPVGGQVQRQELMRIIRLDEERFRRQRLTDVRFVPLSGEHGWQQT